MTTPPSSKKKSVDIHLYSCARFYSLQKLHVSSLPRNSRPAFLARFERVSLPIFFLVCFEPTERRARSPSPSHQPPDLARPEPSRMSLYGQALLVNHDQHASDASSSSSVYISSTAPPSSSSRDNDDSLASDLGGDGVSLSFERVVTSTPRTRRTRPRTTRGTFRDARGEEELRLSDTESLDTPIDDEAIERAIDRFEQRQQESSARRLTSMSLKTHLENDRLLSHTSLTPRGITVPLGKLPRSELYAPSPSTGSSTLVDREDEGKTRSRSTNVVLEEEEEEEEEDANEVEQRIADDEGSSSSPRPTSHRRSTVNNLANYLDARLAQAPSSTTPLSSAATPRRTSNPRRLPLETPHAPGAFPSSTRKPRASYPPSSSVVSAETTPLRPRDVETSVQTPPSASSGSAQIHDAFARYITGPQGALTNSAERRRIAMMQQPASSPEGSSESNVKLKKRERERGMVVETPDFAGRYSFVPRSVLPVEKQQRTNAATAAVDEEGESTGGRSRRANFEGAPRRAVGDKGETEFARRRRREYDERRESEPVAIERETDQEEEQFEEEIPASEEDEIRVAQRSAIDFAMARGEGEEDEADDVGEYDSDKAWTFDTAIPEPRVRRSSLDTSELRSSVRFVEPESPPRRERARTPSPSPPLRRAVASAARSRSSPSRTRGPARAPSPDFDLDDLPPLPPLLPPESPEPRRNLPPARVASSSSFRRSQPLSSDSRRLSSSPHEERPGAVSPERPSRQLDPSTPLRPAPLHASPRAATIHSTSPSTAPPPPAQAVEPPKSSTPPRRHTTVLPPNPDATPPRGGQGGADASPLATRRVVAPATVGVVSGSNSPRGASVVGTRHASSPPRRQSTLTAAEEDDCFALDTVKKERTVPSSSSWDYPLPDQGRQRAEEEVSISHLVEQLSAAVRALSGARLTDVGSSSPPISKSPRLTRHRQREQKRDEQEDELERELTERRAASEARRRELEDELFKLETKEAEAREGHDDQEPVSHEKKNPARCETLPPFCGITYDLATSSDSRPTDATKRQGCRSRTTR